MKIHHFVLATALTTASTANAQSTWDGFYAGGTIAAFSGTNTYGGSADFDLEGQMLGAFAGTTFLLTALF